MRQGMRIFVKPSTFFNQLQWSTHHWVILVAFLAIATIETQVGRSHALYHNYALVLTHQLGIALNSAMWVITFAKLGFLIAGAFVMSSAVWFLGNLFGRRSSRRVLFRRLSIVFMVFLGGYTASHFVDINPGLAYASLALYLWGMLLGYFALREQFALSHLETVVLGLFAMLMVSSSWHFANHTLDSFAREEIASTSNASPRAR